MKAELPPEEAGVAPLRPHAESDRALWLLELAYRHFGLRPAQARAAAEADWQGFRRPGVPG